MPNTNLAKLGIFLTVSISIFFAVILFLDRQEDGLQKNSRTIEVDYRQCQKIKRNRYRCWLVNKKIWTNCIKIKYYHKDSGSSFNHNTQFKCEKQN